jgi:sigma-B regulation protein RsbU (phosphoserine phosphatase)
LARVKVAERQINLRKQLKIAYKDIEREIEMLGDIQSRLLPAPHPPFSRLLIDSLFKPSGRASGDFFDYFPVHNNTVRAAICDVSGHGARAAFLMGVVRTLIRLSERTRLDLAQVVTLLNNSLMDIIGDESDFVSLFLADLNLQNMTISYINAGHCPALLRNGHGHVSSLEANIPILGITALEPQILTYPLHANSSLFLYTDGIYEWRMPDGAYFDQDAFLDLATELMPMMPSNGPFLENLLQTLQNRTQSAIPFRDDVTALYLSVLPEPEQPSGSLPDSFCPDPNHILAAVEENQ